MASTFFRWLIPAIFTVVGGTSITLVATGGVMTDDLMVRGSSALVADSAWAHLTIDGRDALLTGSAPGQPVVDKAIAALAAVPGIRAVVAEVDIAEVVSPFPFSAKRENGTVTLSGGYPNTAAHEAILSAAGPAKDTLRLLGGVPDSATFTAGAIFGLGVLKHLDSGSIQMADLSLTVDGRAATVADYAALQGLAAQIPPGIRLVAQIAPPVASSYQWTASYDGTRLDIKGNEPDSAFADRLRAAVPPTVALELDLTPSSGEPSAFADNALVLLNSLLSLESGEASIKGTEIALSGVPSTSAVAEQVTASVVAIGGGATLDPPQAAEFELSMIKSASATAFAGTVPDKATRQKLADIDGADVQKLGLAHGAPPHFSDALKFGLDALAHLREGQVDLKGTRLSLGGTAATSADFKAITAMLAQPPEGFDVSAGALHPPIASPFTWSATKEADGTVTVAGFVPGEDVRAVIDRKIGNAVSDLADPAEGAPDGFAESAGKGLDVLSLLDSGKLNFDGTKWSIEGRVDTIKKAATADTAYASAGLGAAGWNYVLDKPTLPTIAPYVWQAQKSANGSIAVTGYAPDEDFQQAVKARAAGASDATTLGAGAPVGFSAAALAGVDALAALEDGTVALSGSSWTISGTVADAASADAIRTKLAGATDTKLWSIAIQARDTAPVVAPYLWSATRTADGSVALSGYVPSSALKADIARRAGNVSSDTTTFASGEPSGFEDDVAAALEALRHLSGGRAMFDGGKWSLTGQVTSQAEGDAALTALGHGSQGGKLWNTTLAGYVVAPAPSSSVEASSSAPSPSSAEASSQPDITSVAPLVPASSAPQPAPSSQSPATPPTSSASEAPPAAAPSASAPASEQPASSSVEAASSASVEMSSSASAPASSSEPPPVPTANFPPMPDSLTFEASLDDGGSITLKGKAPSAADIKALAKAAGGAGTKNLAASKDLPDGFTANATAGIDALAGLGQGRLGFDGSRWWLRANAYAAADRDRASATIGAIPGGGDWSIGVTVLAPLDACRAKSAAIAKANSIQFTGRATLTKPSIAVIDAFAALLQACAATNIHVQGHTDSDGAAQANLGVSVARAEAVIAELVKQGVDESRLYAEGFGETDPIASNDTKAGKAANRRISFEIDPQ